jgi:hypothetical protein
MAGISKYSWRPGGYSLSSTSPTFWMLMLIHSYTYHRIHHFHLVHNHLQSTAYYISWQCHDKYFRGDDEVMFSADRISTLQMNLCAVLITCQGLRSR